MHIGKQNCKKNLIMKLQYGELRWSTSLTNDWVNWKMAARFSYTLNCTNTLTETHQYPTVLQEESRISLCWLSSHTLSVNLHAYNLFPHHKTLVISFGILYLFLLFGVIWWFATSFCDILMTGFSCDSIDILWLWRIFNSSNF